MRFLSSTPWVWVAVLTAACFGMGGCGSDASTEDPVVNGGGAGGDIGGAGGAGGSGGAGGGADPSGVWDSSQWGHGTGVKP